MLATMFTVVFTTVYNSMLKRCIEYRVWDYVERGIVREFFFSKVGYLVTNSAMTEAIL